MILLVQLCSIFINVGIILHVFKFIHFFGIKHLMNFKTKKREVKLTFSGKPIFSPEKYQIPLTDNPLHIVVLIPAWNEEASIRSSVESILNQTRRPDKVIVVPNNTTDKTALQAIYGGASVLWMAGKNDKKKAGALNFALNNLTEELDSYPHSAVMVMDADTIVDDDFLEKAEKKMMKNKLVGGVSSIFTGRNSNNLLGTLQQMEFSRFRLQIKKRLEVFVLSGTASLISWSALKKIKEARIEGKLIPKGEGFYDVDSMTEDNELTLALLTLEYTIPHVHINSVTDVMENGKSLYHQRKRWYLGALQNLQMYGRKMPRWMKRIYWFQQIGIFFSSIITPVLLFVFIFYITLILSQDVSFDSADLIVSFGMFCLYMFIQVMTVWDLGWKARITALCYFPDLFYGILLLAYYASAFWTFIRKQEIKWIQT